MRSVKTTNPDPTGNALAYVLHSGQLYGTERMAIATLAAMRSETDGLLLAPPGPAIDHARALGLRTEPFRGSRELFGLLDRFLRTRHEAALIATGVSQSLVGIAVAALRGVRLRHIHAVHGGAADHLSYGRKKWLAPFDVEFVAVSHFVRTKLVAHGVPPSRIRVIGNFLTQPIAARAAMPAGSARRIIVISRLDPMKRVDLVLDALDRLPDAQAQACIHGTGWDEAALRERAARANPNVAFAGYTRDIAAALREADLLVHTCPEEPFGLVVLEAMAAGVPVLVPDRGGPSEFVAPGVNGFVYRAGDAASLADAIAAIGRLHPGRIRAITATAMETVRTRFAAAARIGDYRALLQRGSAWA